MGPNFKRPAAPAAGGYTARPLSTTASSAHVPGGEAQHFVTGSDIAGVLRLQKAAAAAAKYRQDAQAQADAEP